MLAAITVLRDEGAAAVSTTRLAREAGIVQSGFYRHFPSTDACLAAAAAEVVEGVRGPVAESMAVLRREELAPDGPNREALRAHMRRVLALLQPQWALIAVMLQHRRTPGPMGGVLAAAHDDVVADVVGHIEELARARGIPTADHRPRLHLVAALLVDAVLEAAAMLRREPDLGPDTVADVLAGMAHVSVEQAFAHIVEVSGEHPTHR